MCWSIMKTIAQLTVFGSLQARIYQWHDVIIEAGFKADDVVDYIIHLRRCNQVLEWVLLCKSVAYLITQLNKLG